MRRAVLAVDLHGELRRPAELGERARVCGRGLLRAHPGCEQQAERQNREQYGSQR
ncbi:MAG: hypothetical protein NVSMB51_10680 [Solirubrobacteraceae bacterium]